jgi:hypothetical protein
MATITRVHSVELDFRHAIPYDEFLSYMTDTGNTLKRDGVRNLRVIVRSTAVEGSILRFIFEEDYDVDKEDLKEAISEVRGSLLQDKFNIDLTQEELIQLIKEKL